ncbi:hypothetical protein, partial [Cereibacter sphaeroides]
SRSYDSEGNDYTVNTDTDVSASGDITSRTWDSEGNSYEVRTWTDSLGAHTRDSDGNECIVTFSGQMIGCGE